MNTYTKNIVTIIIALGIFVIGDNIASAIWSQSTSASPGGNVTAPVHTGDQFQQKTGNLAVNKFTSLNDTWLALNGGNVGIGTTNPDKKLDVAGSIKIGNDTGTPQSGTIRWTGSDFEGYTGTKWVSLTSGGTTPAEFNGAYINGKFVKNGTEISCKSVIPFFSNTNVIHSAKLQGGVIYTRTHADSKLFKTCDSGFVQGNTNCGSESPSPISGGPAFLEGATSITSTGIKGVGVADTADYSDANASCSASW